ncbi:MAG: TetR/AcrR family transcriptional regulator [Acidobacteriota bacterium]
MTRPVDDYRTRLLEGMAAAVNKKGYADTTIADIVREARVSKRTFYEYFDKKEDCLLALYIAASERTLQVIADTVKPELELASQIDMAIEAYFSRLQESPKLIRTLFIEIFTAGKKGLKVRCAVNLRFAKLLQSLICANHSTTDKKKFPLPLAITIVGGINELVLQTIESDGVNKLDELRAPAAALIKAVTSKTDIFNS